MHDAAQLSLTGLLAEPLELSDSNPASARERTTELIPIENICFPPNRRHGTEEEIQALTRSFSVDGQITPAIVTPVYDEMGLMTDDYLLIAGRNRLEAAKRLGWNNIECLVIDCDQDRARQIEIADNVFHAQLTVLEKCTQIAEWVRLANDRVLSQPETKIGPGRPRTVINAATSELKSSRSQIYRALAIAAITPAAQAAACELGFENNQAALYEISKAPKDRQVTVTRQLAGRRNRSAPATKKDREHRSRGDAGKPTSRSALYVPALSPVDVPAVDTEQFILAVEQLAHSDSSSHELYEAAENVHRSDVTAKELWDHCLRREDNGEKIVDDARQACAKLKALVTFLENVCEKLQQVVVRDSYRLPPPKG